MPTLTIAELITKSPDELSTYDTLIFNDFHDGKDFNETIKTGVLNPAKFIGFCNAIAACSNLNHIDLSDLSFYFLTKEQISLLCKAISHSHLKLEIISLKNALATKREVLHYGTIRCRISEEQAQPIINLIQHCKKLTSINLANNSMDPIHCASPLSKIIEALKYKSLKYLNLEDCDLGVSDFLIETFCDTVQTLLSLECLNLSENFLGCNYLSSSLKQKVFNSLVCCKQLQMLDISGNFFLPILEGLDLMDDQTFQSLTTMLIECVFLEKLIVLSSHRYPDNDDFFKSCKKEELLNDEIVNLRMQEQKKKDKTTLLCFQYGDKPLLPVDELRREVLKWISRPTTLRLFGRSLTFP